MTMITLLQCGLAIPVAADDSTSKMVLTASGANRCPRGASSEQPRTQGSARQRAATRHAMRDELAAAEPDVACARPKTHTGFLQLVASCWLRR